ncbi:hypothetical protein Gotur_032232 [Gossypium turneri]
MARVVSVVSCKHAGQLQQFPSWLKKQVNFLHLDISNSNISDVIPDSFWNLPSRLFNISRSIPSCLNNFTTMANLESSIATIVLGYVYPDIYDINSNIVKYGGFFDDHLGEIPQEIASLQGLITLNLSRNTLRGCIIWEIGQLKVMESLDLSTNLSGEISKSMSDLSFLSVLDLSNNNLFRRIPLNTQLQSFDATSYSGNPRLCRTPLKKCPGDELPKSPKNSNIENRSESDKGLFEPLWFFTGMATGFFVGFWGAFVSLLINRSLRHG